MRFLFVDRILQLVPNQHAFGVKHITPEDHFLTRTHDGRICFSASLIGEALGQLAAWNVMFSHDFSKRPVAGLVNGAYLFRPAYLGETLFLEAFIDGIDEAAVRYHGVARVGDETIFHLESALGPLLPMTDFISQEEVRRQFAEINRPGVWPPPLTGSTQTIQCDDIRCYPMIFDRVLSCEPRVSMCAEKRVSRAASYFPDHFPHKPVLPLTVLLECKFQLLHEFLIASNWHDGYQVSEMRKIKMSDFVQPGDVLMTYLSVKKLAEEEIVLNYRSEVDGTRVCVLDIVLTKKGN